MNTLRQAVQEYLTLRRSLGFKLSKPGKLLPAFVKFMEQHRASFITTKLALAWAQQPSTVQPAEWAYRLSVVRSFARHRSATDPRTQIPPDGLLPYRPKRARPYLYSTKEIQGLLRAALSLPARGSLRPWTYHCLFGLLSVTGLRLGEALNLELQDVDLQAGVLTIRNAKFGKTRLIPIHPVGPSRASRLPRATESTVGPTIGFPLRGPLQLGQSVGSRRHPPDVLQVIPSDRPARSIGQSRAASA